MSLRVARDGEPVSMEKIALPTVSLHHAPLAAGVAEGHWVTTESTENTEHNYFCSVARLSLRGATGRSSLDFEGTCNKAGCLIIPRQTDHEPQKSCPSPHPHLLSISSFGYAKILPSCIAPQNPLNGSPKLPKTGWQRATRWSCAPHNVTGTAPMPGPSSRAISSAAETETPMHPLSRYGVSKRKWCDLPGSSVD